MVVPVAPGAQFQYGRPRRLFEIRFDAGDNGPNYDVSPDGKWFVMPRSNQGSVAEELHIVLNWFSEVSARAQAANAPHATGSPQESAALWRAGQ
jgi:hypothetical protein